MGVAGCEARPVKKGAITQIGTIALVKHWIASACGRGGDKLCKLRLSSQGGYLLASGCDGVQSALAWFAEILSNFWYHHQGANTVDCT